MNDEAKTEFKMMVFEKEQEERNQPPGDFQQTDSGGGPINRFDALQTNCFGINIKL